MKIRLLLLISILFAAMSARADGTESEQRLKAAVLQLNAECPAPIGSIGNMVSAGFDGKTMVMEVSVNKQFDGFFNPENASGINLKDYFITTLPTGFDIAPDTRTLYQLLVESGYGMKIAALDHKSKPLYDVTISPEDIAEVLKAKPDYRKVVALQTAMTNRLCPLSMGGGTLNKIEIAGDSQISEFLIDEKQMSVEGLKGREEMMKEGILSLLSQGQEVSTITTFFQVAKAGYTIVYKYVGNVSGATVSVAMSPAEVLSRTKLDID